MDQLAVLSPWDCLSAVACTHLCSPIQDESNRLDKRMEWMREQILEAAKVREDRFARMVNNEDYRRLFTAFLDGKERMLCVFLNNKEDLVASLQPPGSIKKKGIFFFRKGAAANPISTDKFRDEIQFGDLSSAPLDFTTVLLDDIFLPMVANRRNQDSWPDVMSSDVLKHMHEIKSSLYIVSGQIKGRTLLPPPAGAERDHVDRHLIHAIETAIIEWAHQVRAILRQDSAAVLSNPANHPGPLVELDFWHDRAGNLEGIFEQLKEERTRKMALVLERSGSSYLTAFRSLVDDVVESLREAREINMFLKTLRPTAEQLVPDSVSYSEVKPLLAPYLHTVALIWCNSKYYARPSRLTTLLTETANELIATSQGFLQPEEIFKAEIDDAVERLDAVQATLQTFLGAYEAERAACNQKSTASAASQRCLPWVFDTKAVFARLLSFQEHVSQVRELFHAAVEFLKLEKVEIGGVNGRLFSHQVNKIFREFEAAWQELGSRSQNFLAPEDTLFHAEYDRFVKRIADMETRLGAVIYTAFGDSVNTEAMFKLLEEFGALVDRPIIRSAIEPR
jgi:dynein heavy chain, axonemal